MTPLLVLLLVLLVCAHAERKTERKIYHEGGAIRKADGSKAEDSPWYYHGLDGPSFTNYTVSGLEIREYPAQLWVSVDVEGTQFDVAQNKGFDILFDYISGENEGSVTIDMTTPVLTFVQPGDGPNCASLFTVSFYVPYQYQTAEGPPKPTNEDVYVNSIGPLTVAVDEFSGYALEPEILSRTAKLSTTVENADGLSMDKTEEFVDKWWEAGYDPPFRVTNRHNEVWVPVIVE